MADAFRLNRDMACTRAELMRWLPGAIRTASFRVDGDVVTVMTQGGRVQIAMEEKPPRHIGSMALPVLGVTFCFRGLDEPARNEFLAYFDLYTRRGGG
ncbi:MAG TPA: hypothetical protein VKT00_06125 [Casimicrobiaceae bacterium]|nr:hypothetical protein [Casimicrobiaceae bacterium]